MFVFSSTNIVVHSTNNRPQSLCLLADMFYMFNVIVFFCHSRFTLFDMFYYAIFLTNKRIDVLIN